MKKYNMLGSTEDTMIIDQCADFRLTTNHSKSSYGIPVLVNNKTGNAYGPNDIAYILKADRELEEMFGPQVDEPLTAARIVQDYKETIIAECTPTKDEINFMDSFIKLGK